MGDTFRGMATTLKLAVPTDYLLARDVCSYGFFLLEPNRWIPAGSGAGSGAAGAAGLSASEAKGRKMAGGPGLRARKADGGVFKRICVTDGPRGLRAWGLTITQPEGRGSALRIGIESRRGGARSGGDAAGLVSLGPASSASLSSSGPSGPTAAERAELVAQVTRMLRLDEAREVIRAFHKVDPRFAKSGRGRLFRSPTLFEDIIKTITSCNVAWTSTIRMNQRLCEVVGTDGGFPTAEQLAEVKPLWLRSRCGVGYRDDRIVKMAQLFASGQLDAAWFEDPANSDEMVRTKLLELPGIGPYAASNVLQLLGRFGHLPLDTESVRHARVVLKWRGSGPRLMKRVAKHFAPFGEHRFRSYWFELWSFYEAKRGPSHTWERDTTGKTFTAALLAETPKAKKVTKRGKATRQRVNG